MTLTKLYDYDENVQMFVAGFMSGSGSNLRKIIEHELKLISEQGQSPYHVSVIFSDRFDSKAPEIGRDYDIPVITRDIRGFYKKRNAPLKSMGVRMRFDNETIEALDAFSPDVLAFAGYMSIASPILLEHYLGVNVHPANLSIVDESGKRKYTGDKAVYKALISGEKELRSSTHLVTNEVDGGHLLMVSRPLTVTDPEQYARDHELAKRIAEHYQNVLKEKGDWVIFPKTLEDIALGRFARDENGNLYFDGEPIPSGVRLE
ncbi:MAG: formyltransferase family protein [Nanoarchaeota archaeon]|nr:formyltransferase family protein [Nanoarchaeota archaeon]